jgi:UDP-N-acetylmuramoyl-L-alanyl-D-glutamate--2,6-diaminopimelate ligase
MGLLAAAFAGDPSRDLQVVGITGTNGKTTTAHLLHHVLERAGRRCGLIGTLTGQRTTPESPDLQARLRHFADEGADSVVMEVSSHALALGRVDGTRFAVAVFTNLSRDHLDFHGSMEDYFHAKAMLFDPDRADRAVVNIDDPNGRLLFEAATLPTRGFGMADAADVELAVASSSFRWRDQQVRLPMGGAFNVLNAIGAAEVAIDLGLDPATIADALASVPPAPGRFELVDRGQPFAGVVDYAHTPDGLEQLLRSARRVVGNGRVVVVFGCGGERDVSKRPAMGEVASRLADQLYLTSDNPRGEDPEEIIDDVRRGIPTDRGLVVDPDRRAAIFAAVADAGADDIVVIAGKGHETTQTIGADVLPFDDRVVAAEALDARAGHDA